LEKLNAIASYWGDETNGGRRKYYEITEIGKTLLTQSIRDWKETVQINEFKVQEFTSIFKNNSIINK
jgi:PadR family transcriptional regulator PadR